MLLPPGQVQELNRRSTGMLSSVQRFFAHHLIEAFGCDYSTSGVTLEALTAKIKSFLELRTADGPRHDTYVIFYSGHSHRSGEWALSGKWEPEQDGKCPLLILCPFLHQTLHIQVTLSNPCSILEFHGWKEFHIVESMVATNSNMNKQ